MSTQPSMYQLLALIVFCCESSRAVDFKLEQSAVFVPAHLGDVDVYHGKNGFNIVKNGKHHQVKTYDVDPIVRAIPTDKLKRFLQKGYLSINRMNNDDFTIKANVRGLGGFLLTGVIVYQTVRVVGHASVWAAAATSIVGAAITLGPPGASAAYLTTLATIGPALATVETGALTLGTAASFIPGLP